MASIGRDKGEDTLVGRAAPVTGDKGESFHFRDEHSLSESPQGTSIEYIGTIRKEMRRILPHVLDLPLLRWSEGKVREPLLDLGPLSSNLSSESRSESWVVFVTSPNKKGSTTSPNKKGKTADSSKGKETAPPPEAKKTAKPRDAASTGDTLMLKPREGTSVNPATVLRRPQKITYSRRWCSDLLWMGGGAKAKRGLLQAAGHLKGMGLDHDLLDKEEELEERQEKEKEENKGEKEKKECEDTSSFPP
ncbi:hypothetical protein Acr_00g0032210 [Actinidia rufa]|uniref:Uncharacterized protein n=1 Tax=Actinidia rufa TaxID=165716 RepID=A0A7J0DFA4_9ERIC|nr:hypothetical protein Acr_00g0032210 [Actinidia rufa]